MSNKGKSSDQKVRRIAIVNPDRCKPKKCRQECKRVCPVVKMGKECIIVKPTSVIATISEELCVGCTLCIKKCPFDAIDIINLPSHLEDQITHRYGENQFMLHRLPIPRPGQVLGLIGTNGIGKSTAIKILANKLKPNLGKFKAPPDWKDVITYFRGSELQNYFTKLLEYNLQTVIKPQHIDQIPRAIKGGTIDFHIAKRDERGVKDFVVKELDLENILDRDITKISGGELQRFAIGVACVRDVDIYMMDEPSSYLDIKQRIRAARVIRTLLDNQDTSKQKYVIAVEHDLAVLDYLSDFVCVLYGVPSVYGVITMPFSVREGLNIFLDGFIPTENMRFRNYQLSFKIAEVIEREDKKVRTYSYGNMKKKLGNFTLEIEGGEFTDSEIIVLLGQNGTGKTTFIKMLTGITKPDEGEELPTLHVSYKPQNIVPKYKGSVRSLLQAKIGNAWQHPQFMTDVTRPLKIEPLLDLDVQTLSGGELQRVGLCLCLGKPADVYLIDEPSAHLDAEMRIITARVIKRFVLHAKKTAFVVEHDFIMATYLADRVVLYTGTPSVETVAHTPQSLLTGMNSFLKSLEITLRRDPTNFRPRINKFDSIKDREQKSAGTYFFIGE